jgi:hypothetical protein
VPLLLGVLTHSDRRERALATLVLEAAWALTNIVSGDTVHVKRAVEAGCIPILCDLMHAADAGVREQVTCLY